MLKQGRSKCRKMFTMIELMIVVIIVAILAASAVPIYRSAVSRAYEGEVGMALGVVRSAQSVYRAEHGEYASEFGELDIEAADFEDMAYVTGIDQFSLAQGSGGTTYTAVWSGTIDGANFNRATINQDGDLEFTTE